MLIIRLQRVGRKNIPTFRLVVTDSKNGPKSGKVLEILGNYDTRINNKVEQFDTPRIKHWIAQGAQVSGTVHNFLVGKKVIEGKKINVLPKKKPIKKEEEKKEGEVKAEVPSDPSKAEAGAPKVEPAPTV